MKYIFTLIILFFSASPAFCGEDANGYLEPPEVLFGEWQDAQPRFYREFFPDLTYRSFFKETGIAYEYGFFKVFLIKDDVVYALESNAWNPEYPDRNLTPKEITNLDYSYGYVIYDLTRPRESYGSSDDLAYMRYYDDICRIPMSSPYFDLTIEQSINLPATVHIQNINSELCPPEKHKRGNSSPMNKEIK